MRNTAGVPWLLALDLVENSDGHFVDGAIGVDNVREEHKSFMADWFEKVDGGAQGLYTRLDHR